MQLASAEGRAPTPPRCMDTRGRARVQDTKAGGCFRPPRQSPAGTDGHARQINGAAAQLVGGCGAYYSYSSYVSALIEYRVLRIMNSSTLVD